MTDAAGDRLRGYIEGVMADRGIASVSELARRAHVSRDTFQAWWRGRPPQRSTAELVARELGVTYADLVTAREGTMAETAADDVATAYLEKMESLLGLLGTLVKQNATLIAHLVPPPDDPLLQRQAAAVAEAEEQAREERARSTSIPRGPDRRRGAEQRRARQEDAAG